MTTLEPPADCAFFLSPNIYARARVSHVSRQDFTTTVELVDGLYDRLGKQLYPPGTYFTIQGDQQELRVHSVIRNGDAFEVYLLHDQDQRMRGMNGEKRVIVLATGQGESVPITTDDVDVFAQLIAKWAVEDELIVASYQEINLIPRRS